MWYQTCIWDGKHLISRWCFYQNYPWYLPDCIVLLRFCFGGALVNASPESLRPPRTPWWVQTWVITEIWAPFYKEKDKRRLTILPIKRGCVHCTAKHAYSVCVTWHVMTCAYMCTYTAFAAVCISCCNWGMMVVSSMTNAAYHIQKLLTGRNVCNPYLLTYHIICILYIHIFIFIYI